MTEYRLESLRNNVKEILVNDEESRKDDMYLLSKLIDSSNNVKLKENTSIILQNRDVITIGDCILTFIPFCDEEFSWYDKE